MNENTRTGLYVVTALVVGALAFATAPASLTSDSGPVSYPPGTKLFADIKADQIKALEIQRYDDKLAKKNTFKVAVKGNKWVIPSHGDYLADAQKQLANITKALVSAELYEERSADQQDHETYGVVDPADLKEGDVKKGVGTLISAMDDSGKVIAKVIVGVPESGVKKDDEQNQFSPVSAEKEEGRFLRVAGEQATKVGKIDLDVFSTEFAKWIEPDLLQLNALDVTGVDIRDYAILRAADQRGNVRPFLEMRSENALALDPSNKWAPKTMSVFKDNDSIEQPLAEDEEINNEQLNQLKTAVDDLKIVDVERKPEGVGDLVVNYDASSGDKANSLDQETMQELVSRGYYPNPKAGIMGANGEVRVSTKDGIDYLLRFGETKGLSDSGDKKLNRYLMVTAQFNPDAIPKPVLAPVPPGPQGPSEGEEEAAADEAKSDDETKADESKEDRAKEDGAKEEVIKEGDPNEAEKRLAAERERIIKNNKRQQEQYADAVRLGQAKVKDLNNRFRDWFYVISDDVYRKIHLDRRKIVKLNPNAKEKSYTVDAFHELEKEGIETAAPPPPPRTRP